ncbi:ABC transporter ATP-binding protein [Fictibacillus macauensis ZFHKF-1]|uniref:ABC transporter ATP-binding protein n=1 Tax=Fictibacillus macauensis ZFHKF-1 TaxID=1196324 RepID=I8UJ10_9BACL|nr:ABC transporter transmembrane domain-containing protein [Fictibacillus macauensis]EIT86875.1 ABC transporter ATP-binding protein [Fictibacillus macauensis ZFHKF-1]
MSQRKERKQQWMTLKRLLAYLKGERKRLSFAVLCLILASGAELTGPILIKHVLDEYVTKQRFPTNTLMMLGMAYVSLLIVAAIFHYVQLVLFQTTAMHVIQTMRNDLFAKVQKLSLRFYDLTPVGSLVSRITNDTEAIKDLYMTVLSTFVQNIVFLTGIFIAMFSLNVTLGLFCLSLLPLIGLIMMNYRKYSSQSFLHMREKLSALNAKLHESIQGMMIVQAFRQQKRVRQEFQTINEAHHAAWMKNMKWNGLLLRPAVDLVYVFSIMLILSYFGTQSFTNTVEVGVIYAFVAYIDRFFEPVNMMMSRLATVQQAIVAGERVFALSDEKEEEVENRTTHPSPVIASGEIQFDNVSFSYDGERDVLKNISFTAKAGQMVALVGHTGSGKSSISNVLMRFYPYHSGEVRLDGELLEQFSEQELRSNIGLVLQDSFLFSGDVAHNVRFFSNASMARVEEVCQFVQVSRFIEKLPEGYHHPVAERGSRFSSGERQLLSFARTMIREPRILILDEATATIDTQTEEALQRALQVMRQGRTTLAIAHRLSTIQAADLILVLHQGVIIERGTHEELLALGGQYYRMFSLQQGIMEKIQLNSD